MLMDTLKKPLLIVLLLVVLGFIAYALTHLTLFEKTLFARRNNSEVNVYANTNIGMFSKAVNNHLFRVYVPNSYSKTVSVIDPTTYKVIDTFVTGKNPQHIAPAYHLDTLWVLNDLDNSLTAINPKTGKPSKKIPVYDPYNMYYTPDGKFAIVIGEAGKRFDFLDSKTMKLIKSVPVKCRGLNHIDFTIDGKYALASCEFSGDLLKLDVLAKAVVAEISLNSCTKKHCMPQDVRLSPDGRTFYVADMMRDGVFLVDAKTFRPIGFIETGIGTHSIYPSRDGRYFYVGNRGCHSPTRCQQHGPGSVAVIDPKLQKVIALWPVPQGGSPDMGNLSPDGKELWLSGRYDSEVYVFDTRTGNLIHRIAVGGGPHGLTVWPQPGNYSLGHTGNMR
jgi:YVTN family beta-propeller protein